MGSSVSFDGPLGLSFNSFPLKLDSVLPSFTNFAIRDPWDFPTPLKLKCKMVKVRVMVKVTLRVRVGVKVGVKGRDVPRIWIALTIIELPTMTVLHQASP